MHETTPSKNEKECGVASSNEDRPCGPSIGQPHGDIAFRGAITLLGSGQGAPSSSSEGVFIGLLKII